MARKVIDPEENWGEYVVTLYDVVERIARKFTEDEDLRQDCVQFAIMNLLKKRPSQCNKYGPYKRGEITYEVWLESLNIYLRQCAKNKILSLLHSPTHGDWYVGRTLTKVDPETGDRIKTHVGPRYSSFDDLQVNHGLDITDEGEPTWPKVTGREISESGGFRTNGGPWTIFDHE